MGIILIELFPSPGQNSKGLKGPGSYVASGQTIGNVIINI